MDESLLPANRVPKQGNQRRKLGEVLGVNKTPLFRYLPERKSAPGRSSPMLGALCRTLASDGLESSGPGQLRCECLFSGITLRFLMTASETSE